MCSRVRAGTIAKCWRKFWTRSPDGPMGSCYAHDPEKWEPVFGSDHAPIKKSGSAHAIDLVAQATHAGEPAVAVGSFACHVFTDLRVRQNQKVLLFHRFEDNAR